MSEELRPCPFCGLHVELVSAKTYPNGERSPAYIKCKRCNYHIAGYEDKDVINQWNTRSAIRKEFCPNCEKETECEFTAELYECKECGEDFAKYIVSRNCNVSDVSTTQDVLIDVKTPRSIENNNPDYYKHDELKKENAELKADLKNKNTRIAELEAENERLSQLLHDEMSQLEIATDLGNKRWTALNKIYEHGEKHNTNWCKRKAQEGLGIKNA